MGNAEGGEGQSSEGTEFPYESQVSSKYMYQHLFDGNKGMYIYVLELCVWGGGWSGRGIGGGGSKGLDARRCQDCAPRHPCTSNINPSQSLFPQGLLGCSRRTA